MINFNLLIVSQICKYNFPKWLGGNLLCGAVAFRIYFPMGKKSPSDSVHTVMNNDVAWWDLRLPMYKLMSAASALVCDATGEQLATRRNQSLEDARHAERHIGTRKSACASVHLPNNERVPLSLSACTHPPSRLGGWLKAVANANRSFILCLIAPERILEPDNCHGGRAHIHMLYPQ